MHLKKFFGKTIPLFLIMVFLYQPAIANKSAVTIEFPEKPIPGEEIVVKIMVTHNGNSTFHYTNLLVVTVNQKEFARFEFKANNRPESENFSREVKIKFDKTLEIKAEAFCNVHGSNGPATVTIKR